MNFEEWLEAKNIDIRSIEPEMEVCLREQYEWAMAAAEPAQVLVIPSDCLWPARGYWLPLPC